MALYIINIDLTLGSSGSTYTAPANGWVQAYIHWQPTTSASNVICFMSLFNTSRTDWFGGGLEIYRTSVTTSTNGLAIAQYCPFLRGDTIRIAYSSTSSATTSGRIRFFYADGVPSA